MNVFTSILIILIASLALIKGVDWFVSSVTNLARHFKISGYTISFFLVAIGTSLPETVVAITASVNNNPILAFGNAMGSNIALITLIVAIPAIFTSGISTRTILNSKDIYFAAVFAIVPVLLVIDGELSRIDGVIMLLGYAVYSYAVLQRAVGLESLMDSLNNVSVRKELLMFLGSLAILLISSEFIVRGAITLSKELMLGLGFIGLTVTAIGTSLPEIAFTYGAIKRHEKEEIMGDIIGSVVANSTLVLGLAALITPINLGVSRIGIPTIFFLIFTLLVFLRFARTKESFSTLEGVALVLLYCVFVIIEYLVSQGMLVFS